jgi:hypothetical protein
MPSFASAVPTVTPGLRSPARRCRHDDDHGRLRTIQIGLIAVSPYAGRVLLDIRPDHADH